MSGKLAGRTGGAGLRAQDVVRLALREVAGPVLVPGTAEYDAECATHNLNCAVTPAVVVGATSEGDVREAVRFAAAQGIPVAVKSAAHQIVGAADGAVLITTHRMKRMSVDVEARTVRAEAGCGGVRCCPAPRNWASPRSRAPRPRSSWSATPWAADRAPCSAGPRATRPTTCAA